MSASISNRSTAMSSDYAFIAYLVQIQTNFYRIGGPILMVIGTLSCTLSFMVFMRKNLRKNPCSIYLMAVNVSNILLIFTSISLSTLAIGYKIDPSLSNLRFCRFRYYVMFLFDILGPSYLILAAIDRVLLTSPNALTRQRSTPRLAYTCIIIATVFWTLMHLHAAIVTDIVQIRPGVSLCFFQLGMHLTVMTYYSLIIKGILIPLLMLIFGLWSVKNVRGVRQITSVSVVSGFSTAITRRTHTNHSKDRQLLRILLMDITVYVIFNGMIAIVLMYRQINGNKSMTLVEMQIQSLLTREAI